MKSSKKKPTRKIKPTAPAKPKRDLYAELSERLAGWKPSRDGMHSINIVHRYDRLNKVLGVTGWSKQETITSIEPLNEFDDQERRYWMATAAVHIDLPGLGKGVFREGRGGHKNVDRGDAEKGAVSDAAGNALKDLVGKEAYLGQLDAPLDESHGNIFRLDKDGPPPKPTDKDVFVPFNGIITEIIDGLQGSWIQISGETCYAEKRLAGYFDESLNRYAEGNAKWWWPDGVTPVKKITGVIGVSAIAPMKIPTINERES